ncbi:MAG: FadR family transcriptional regulator [Desulfobacterales bacterium]|nr:FadR family transcriptional regulator [Desulfobacterales bacterium]
MTIPLKKITASEAVVESLKDRIRSCEFGPGEKLPSEQELLKEYDVSRLTLREALAKLAAWGVIQVHHGKGAFVSETVSVPALDNVLIPLFPQINADRMGDLVEARNSIESEIAAKVAETRTREQIQELERLLEFNPKRIIDAESFAERDYTFHLTLVRQAGNDFFLSMYQALHLQIHTFLVQYARSVMDWEKALSRHVPILEAIVEQDKEKARFLAREHARICASHIKGSRG